MIYLLDTHTWIWWNMNPEKLSQRVKEIIGNTNMYDEYFYQQFLHGNSANL